MFNKDFQAIGEHFVKIYYELFDDPARREQLCCLYSDTDSLMSFQGSQHQGSCLIMEKFKSLTFQTIKHDISSVDCQPTAEGGVMVSVVGQLQMDTDQPIPFTHSFLLRQRRDSCDFFCQNEMFRLVVHDK